MEVIDTVVTSASLTLPSELDRNVSSSQRQTPQTRPTLSKVVVLLMMPVLAAALSYFLVRNKLYALHGDPPWIQASSRIYTAAGVDCQIAIYGDSTAITGLDPHVIARETGLPTCNIAQGKGAIVVLGTSGLDLYLRKNKRPKYLVLQFDGADFYRPASWDDAPGWMEGVIADIRYYPRWTLVSILLRHPKSIIGMMRYAYVTAPMNWWRNWRHPVHFHYEPESPVSVHFIRPEPAYTSCREVVDLDPMFHKPDAAFVDWLRNHYGQLADHLIIDVAPTSPCDPRVAYLRANLAGIDNTLQVYPLTFFNEGYQHYTAPGAEHLSLQVARQINSIASASGSQASALPTSSLSPGELH